MLIKYFVVLVSIKTYPEQAGLLFSSIIYRIRKHSLSLFLIQESPWILETKEIQ